MATQQPRYMQLAQTLIDEIQGGLFPVGATIPTEFALCDRFGASRSTVREAVKQLVQLGMVKRQAGVGTTVTAVDAAGSYKQVMQQLSDLQRYSADTVLHLKTKRMAEITDPSLCESLQAQPGDMWLRLDALRRSTAHPDPICHTEVYIQSAFRTLSGLESALRTPIFSLIERQFDEQIVEVEQEIRAVALTAGIARQLNARARDPALWIQRRYLNSRAEVLELSISIHPADRFRYVERFQRGWTGS